MNKLWGSLALAGVLCLGSTQVSAVPIDVDLELVLAVDVSGSVDATRYQAQKQGYINAFRDSSVIDTIMNGALGSIAVTYMEWSGANQQSQQVGWTQISDSDDSNAFADAIEATTRAFSGLTGISQAIDWSVDAFVDNGFEGTRRVIDISGDGSDNTSGDPDTSRDAAVDAGIVINGIAIEEVTGFSLTDYYAANVIGGPGSFVLTATTFEDFEQAINQKLRVEIGGEVPVPVPATLGLMGIGILGLAMGLRSRRVRGNDQFAG